MPESEGTGAPRAMRIDVRTRFGRLQGNLAVPPGPMRLSELAWNAMAFDERLVAMAVKSEAAEGREVSCKKGCGACCRQAIPMTLALEWASAHRDAGRERYDAAQLMGALFSLLGGPADAPAQDGGGAGDGGAA